ncbi:MAG: response regulator transcription factor [Oscillospiraceae bacterium]|nr:response regulator transcription factor [Oscillospiraceae bacterium]
MTVSSNKYKILIVEDEANIRNFVKTVLEANEYQVLQATTCEEGILMAASHMPDVIILDLGLPDRDGQHLITTVRQNSNVPILVLSARTQENDKVSALDLGANDYITKPFGTAELMARVRAALRSRRLRSEAGTKNNRFVLGDLVIDYDKRQVLVAGNDIKVTQTEFNILSLLSVHRGKVLTYSLIVREIWGGMDDGSIKKLQVNMANIRKKMGSKPGDNRYILNELGVGYRMRDEEEIS